ncbi:zeta toxin family protein [Streptomyces sp. NPDC093093]|uniref:zeta toxin family protein n=1 Tax=Streptomyces sp. NPDC093093 TaxID=3366025 RepID=UPI0038282440
MREDDLTAGGRVRPDVLRWQAEVKSYLRRERFDAILEAPIADLAEAIATAGVWRTAGYRVEVVALATSEAEAQLSGLDRYLTQVDEQGVGRSVSWGNLEQCTRNLPLFLEAVEAERLADQVMVVRRGLHVLYRNELTADGTSWCEEKAAPEALTAEWGRPGPRRRSGSSGAAWPAPSSACARRSSPRSVASRSPEGWSAPSRWPSRCAGSPSRSPCRPGSTTTACPPASTGGSSTS